MKPRWWWLSPDWPIVFCTSAILVPWFAWVIPPFSPPSIPWMQMEITLFLGLAIVAQLRKRTP